MLPLMPTMDCWQTIFSFCDFGVLEILYIYGTDEIRTIFSGRHFLEMIVKREKILPQLLTQPVTNFIHCCQLVRLDKTVGSKQDLLQIAHNVAVPNKTLADVFCLNGRHDAKEMFDCTQNNIYNVLSMMVETHRGSVKNVIAASRSESKDDGIAAISILLAVVNINPKREDVMYFIDKDKELLSAYSDAVEMVLRTCR